MENMTMIELIKADQTHLPIIKDIAERTWPNTFGDILSAGQIKYMLDLMYSIPALSSQILEKNHVFLLAKIKEEYMGYASYELNYKNSKKTKIHKIYILPSAQGKGFGKALMEKIVDIAIHSSNYILSLNVNRNNPAVDFYQKIGFQIVDKEDIDIGNGFLMEDFVMEKIAAPST